MRKIINTCFALLLVFLIACRKDFIVENIDNKTITVNSPANNLATTANTITFWWEPVDGAEKYNLQVVKPDFASMVELVMDTSIVGTRINVPLDPGLYQWRIKATNAGHSTAFQTFNLKVDTTSDLTDQLVNLLSPANGATTSSTVMTFNWKSIPGAKQYRFQLTQGTLTLKDTTFVNTSLTCTLVAAKNATTTFNWNVKAINDFSESQFNATPFKVTVDLKGPTTPGLVSPANLASLSNLDTLKWTHATDTKYDSIYVADDSTFYNVVLFSTDQNFIPVFELNLSPNTPGTYYWWKVKSFDTYGNPSAYSLRRKFKLN